MPEPPSSTDIPVFAVDAASEPPPRATGLIVVLVFVFGIAAGVLLAFAGAGVVSEVTGGVLFVGSVALILVISSGLAILLFRKPLLRRLFGIAETEVTHFSAPLADVARAAIDRDPKAATDSARALINVAAARYVWLATRRWIIGSLTALIAAMAALAGTALLYQQNILLTEQLVQIEQQNALLQTQTDMVTAQTLTLDRQTELLAAQSEQIDRQNLLAEQSVQLAEAARNAQLAVEIAQIADDLGQMLDRAMANAPRGTVEDMVPVLDPFTDLDRSLVMRIVAISRAARPYRFLELDSGQFDLNDRGRTAMLTRPDLPQTFAAMADDFGWSTDQGAGTQLVDRPASAERAQILFALLQAGVRDLDLFTFFGLDLSFGAFNGMEVIAPTLRVARLSFADFSHAEIASAKFGGASFDHARFHNALIYDTDFSSARGASMGPIFDTSLPVYRTSFTGTDFAGAAIRDTGFGDARFLAARFEHAALVGVDFTGASLAAASFANAVLLDVDLTGADLRSVELDGAIVIGPDWLDQVASGAAPGTFRPDRFELQPASFADVIDLPAAFLHFDTADLAARIGGRGVFRVVRVQPFEQ